MKYSDSQRIEKMRETTKKLLAYIEQSGISKDDILNNETIQWTVTTPLYNIGEQAYFLSDEYKEAHPSIPWPKIAGLRHSWCITIMKPVGKSLPQLFSKCFLVSMKKSASYK